MGGGEGGGEGRGEGLASSIVADFNQFNFDQSIFGQN